MKQFIVKNWPYIAVVAWFAFIMGIALLIESN